MTGRGGKKNPDELSVTMDDKGDLKIALSTWYIKWTAESLLFLAILFVRGVTLPGASDGLYFYLVPDLARLYDFNIWRLAAGQVFFTLGVASGVNIALASYNRFDKDILRNAVSVALVNSATSLVAGLVIFSVTGFLAHETGRAVEDVVSAGTSLVFIAYPEAIARIPGSSVWAVLFFLVLIMLAVSTQFASVEAVITGILDKYTSLRQYKTSVLAAYCLVSFGIGVPTLCTSGGHYVYTLVESYATGWNYVLIALVEILTIAYLYGAARFWDDISSMIGKSVFLRSYWMFTWRLSAPILIGVVALVSLLGSTSAPVLAGYVFPSGAVAVGWAMTLSPLVVLVLFALNEIARAPVRSGLIGRLRSTIEPVPDWGPALDQHQAERPCLQETSTSMELC